jgi:hypothetical protein
VNSRGTIRLLRPSNETRQPFFLRFFDPSHTIDEALTRGGHAEVRRVAEMIIKNEVPHSDLELYCFKDKGYWMRAYCVAKTMALEVGGTPSFAYATALLRDIGRTIIQRRRDENSSGFLGQLTAPTNRHGEIAQLGYDNPALDVDWMRKGRFSVIMSTAVELIGGKRGKPEYANLWPRFFIFPIGPFAA